MDLLINAAELESLKRTIFNAQEVLYGMDHVARSGNIANENHGFDQNNYFLSNNVLSMKEEVYSLLIEKRIIIPINPMVKEYKGAPLIAMYGDKMGTNEEIEEFIKRESIQKYVKDLLYVTKEKNDNYHEIPTFLFFRNIMHHYGFTEQDDEAEKKFYALLSDALQSATTPKGQQYSDGTFDSIEHSQKVYHQKLKAAEDFIVSYVEQAANRALQQRKIRDEKRQQSKQAASQVQSPKTDQQPEPKPEPNIPPQPQPTAAGQETTIEELMNPVALNEELMRVTQARINIARKTAPQASAEVEKAQQELAKKQRELDAILEEDQKLAERQAEIIRKLGIK